MLLGFKRRFSAFVEDGSKPHTIRAKRKKRPRAGETCHCYVDPRQKTMRLLRRSPCIRVDDVELLLLNNGTIQFSINGEKLCKDEARELAWRDGFRTHPVTTDGPLKEMAEFWKAEHGAKSGDVFRGDLISWNPAIRQDKRVLRRAA
jgi:hypothetical protein